LPHHSLEAEAALAANDYLNRLSPDPGISGCGGLSMHIAYHISAEATPLRSIVTPVTNLGQLGLCVILIDGVAKT